MKFSREIAPVVSTLLILTSTGTSASYFTYSEWERMSVSSRAAYIAGSVDSLIGYAVTAEDQKRVVHYTKCLEQSKMDNGQLADNVMAFAKGKPDVQRYAPQAALLQYLIQLCGKPPA